MQRFDSHIHLNKLNTDADVLLSELAKAGMQGGAVFSVQPEGYTAMKDSAPYEQRLADVLKFTENHRDRLFPILWIDPREDEILAKIDDASKRGILGFKMICSDYYPYEDRCQQAMERIARNNKAVIFHTGILWDGRNSSNYNKPLNWECCLEIPKLRFLLAHCSWPWYDECIAVYGKFLNALTKSEFAASEMFMDITPGTPIPYRRDLLTKLYTVGYDVKHNILFGTDCVADNYNVEWSLDWQKRDDEIYRDLHLDDHTLNCIYCENLKRFLGVSRDSISHSSPTSDGNTVVSDKI